jgi:hypothetical protein
MLLSNGEWRQIDQITTALPAAVIWNQELNQTTFLTAIRKSSTTPRNFPD